MYFRSELFFLVIKYTVSVNEFLGDLFFVIFYENKVVLS